MLGKLSILGPGLLGASIAKAARDRALAEVIDVWAHRGETRLACEQADWCDGVHARPEDAVVGAELVVVATPVDTIVDLLRRVAGALPDTARVTDVGSTKSLICRHGRAALEASGAAFVGAHPMAGSEKSGHAHAHAGLFEGRVCFLTPMGDTAAEAVDAVGRFWKALGMDLVTVSPEAHDEIVAHVSHLPHVLAAALCSYLGKQPEDWRHFAGPGLKDATRIAGGSPALWVSIIEQNREEVLRALAGLQDEISELERAVHNRQSFALKALLERGAAFRKSLRPEPPKPDHDS